MKLNNLLFFVLASLKQYNRMHKNESMKQPNRSELSILTFLLLIIQKKVLKKMVSQLRTGANLVVSQIQKIGTSTKSRRERYIGKKKYLRRMDLSLTCVPLRNPHSGVAETDLPSTAGN